MDDTQKEGSDSDWDSTLDFTSPRQVGIGKLRPDPATEIDEESALSEESDIDAEESLPNDKQVIRNVLKPQEERPRAPSPNQKENNIVLAQKQQNLQQKQDQPANQRAQQARNDQNGPPYNFRDALTDKDSPETAAERGPPGKQKKGTTYDPAPSPTPRGVQKNQGSIRSVGSWDESDPDEKTLREIRSNYQQEKQKEEQKIKEAELSVAEEPLTARSETTQRSWRFGRKNKQKNNQSKGTPQATPRGQPQQQQQPQSARSHGPPDNAPVYAKVQKTPQQQVQRSQEQTGYSGYSIYDKVDNPHVQEQVSRTPAVSTTARSIPTRGELTSPTMVEVIEPGYSLASAVPAQRPVYGDQGMYSMAHLPQPTFDRMEEEMFEEPKKLIEYDEDKGRSVFFFGQGNLRYFEINEEYEEAVLPPVADKFDRLMQRIWQEVFAILRMALSIVIFFIVELLKFLAKHIFQPLVIAIFMSFGDYVIKPLLSVFFNGMVQPVSIFMWNVFSGMRHMFNPIGEILRRVFEQLAMLLRSVRLFEVTYVYSDRDTGPARRIQTV